MAVAVHKLAVGIGDDSDHSAVTTGLWLFFLALVVRLAFLPIANNNGTDAWARYLIARSWLEHPTQLPSDVWLPLHFWLLGVALSVWNSEYSARLFTVLFGAATILPYWGALRRIFDSRVAWWSAILFALFGFHVAYSVTTSSEAPTLFFLALGFYAWVRFYLEDTWGWLVVGGIAFSAASLCRVEPWLYLPVLAAALLVSSSRGVAYPTSKSWLRLVGFTLAAAPGAVGWIAYSLLKWGEPFAVASRSSWLSLHLNVHQPLLDRLVAVPGAILVTLSPVVAILALIGICRNRHQDQSLVVVTALLVAVLGGINGLLAVKQNSTMARYTLMYSWLLIPFAFDALQLFPSRWPWLAGRKAFAGVLIFFLVWQGGITAGAYYGPPKIADKLSSVSPTLPLEVESRKLVLWLDAHRSPQDAVIFDDFNYGASDLIRYAHIPASEYFQVPYLADPTRVRTELNNFLVTRHPHFLVYSPSGLLRNIWSAENHPLDDPNVVLSRQWQQGNWEIYSLSYEQHH